MTVLAAACLASVSAVPAQAADESVAVDFAGQGATPSYRASGWIYGMTEDASAPPDHFFRDVNFQYMRAGGAQLDSPGGWVSGKYDRRWDATLAQARRTAELGGEFVLLVHDLWGADGSEIPRFPGDNGDWSDYDAFLTRVINDVKASGLTVQWDIWNEPDLGMFWDRSQEQYLEMWKRAYERIRVELPDQVIVGPSSAHPPSTSNGWWNTYLDFIKDNNAVPDIFSYHGLPSDPLSNATALNEMLDARDIPHPNPYQMNEYASVDEQNPADGAWYIARLERAGTDGLRANWGTGSDLHNDLANLLVRDESGEYHPKGEWWVYRFYAQQNGEIASTTPSESYDLFATQDNGVAKVLVGGGSTTGNVRIDLKNLDDTEGLVQDGKVRAVVENIPFNGGQAVEGPAVVEDTIVDVTADDTATLNLEHANVDDTLTVTLLPPS